jgi:hypothetical protein
MDMIVRIVADYGHLPIVLSNGKEVYRGEFQATAHDALDKCIAYVGKMTSEGYEL